MRPDAPELAGGEDLSSLQGMTIRLSFALKDADLFAFRFRS